MPKEQYILPDTNDMHVLQVELQRILEAIALRLNYIAADGDNNTFNEKKIVDIAIGVEDSDVVRKDQLLGVINLAASIKGTINRITIIDNLDGTITLNTPQDTHQSADVTFDTLKLEDMTPTLIPFFGVGGLISEIATFLFDSGLHLKADSLKLLLGAGDDAGIYYDGTDFWINSHAVGTGNTNIGDATNRTEFESTGDVNFVGGAGLQFGQIYEEDGVSTLTLAAQDIFYQVISFTANGESNGTTPDHTNDHITVSKSGKYLVFLDVSFSQIGAVSIEYDFHVQKNNGATDFSSVSAHRDTSGNSVVGATNGTGIIDLTAGDTVEVWVERLSGGAVSKTITIPQISLVLTQIVG